MRIQILANIIDQLDLALDQLPSDDANRARFAMMLIDNAMELGMHQIAEDDADRSAPYRADSTEPDDEWMKAALGQRFEDKVAYLAHCELIGRNESESLRMLHRVRNEVYHRGIRHESILSSLSKFYFSMVCDVLRRWKPFGFSWSNRDAIPFRAQKYLGQSGSNKSGEAYIGAYGRLKEIGDGLPNDLAGTLAAHMASVIDETNRLIDFINEGDPEVNSRQEAVIDAQVWSLAFSDKALELATAKGYRGKDRHSLLKWLRANYRFSVPKDPISTWNKRLSSLRCETNGHVAIKKYADFTVQTQEFRDSIERTASLLDQHIESQIDAMREERAMSRDRTPTK